MAFDDTHALLLREYGGVLDTAATARVMGYPSADALREARLQKRLPIEMFRLPHRRGWFASAESVARWLSSVHPSN
jgi:hypothetical protein